MQALQRTLQQIARQLGRLTVNAQLLIGSMIVILVMGLLLVSQYAGQAEMSPLGLPMTAETRAAAVSYLENAGIAYEDRGSDIYVPAGRQFAVLGRLNEQQIVAAEEIDFNALIDLSANPFISSEQARRMWLTAKMNGLSAMIAARDDVRSARVIIDDPPGQPGIGRANIQSTATVTLVMQSGTTLNQDVADTIGSTIAGAHAGLKPQNVTVTAAGSARAFRPRTDEELGGGDYLEHKRETEVHYRRMIEDALRHIPGAVVTVNAVIENTHRTISANAVEDPKIGPRYSETEDYTASNASTGGEPAVRPNTGAAIAGGGGGGSQVSKSVSKEEVDSRFGNERKLIEDRTGYPLQINAIVGIPKSFFVRVYRAEQGDPQAEPDPATLSTIVQRETVRWQQDLEPLIRTEGLEGAVPGVIRVSMVHDFESATAQAGVGAAIAGGGVGGLLGGEGGGMIKNVGLAALALVSLVMMFLMVRRASVREELPSASELVGVPPALEAAESQIVGEAEESTPALDGMELDERSFRTSQLLDQINQMVERDPNEAANLFRRWVATEE